MPTTHHLRPTVADGTITLSAFYATQQLFENRRAAPLEGGPDRFDQNLRIERKTPAHGEQVVVVVHAAVRQADRADGL